MRNGTRTGRIRGWLEKNPAFIAVILTVVTILLAVAALARDTFNFTLPGGDSAPREPAAPATSPSAGADAGHTAVPATTGSTPDISLPASPASQARVVKLDLPQHAAVDVDAGTSQVLTDRDGLDDVTDMFHDSGSVLSDVLRTPNGVFGYPAGKSIQAAYEVCSDYTSPNPSYTAYQAVAAASTGNQFCFTTSAGRLGFVVVDGNRKDGTVLLTVRVWDR